MSKEELVEKRLIWFEDQLEFFVRHSWITILILCGLSFVLRFSFFTDLPLTYDALSYFTYANDFLSLGRLPPIQLELGWPILLSVFFSVFRFENIIDFMTLQRVLSVSISVLTIIPVYFLCKRFFDKRYALVGSAIFVFEPHLIQNSILGVSEPLYLLLGTLSILLFLNKNIRLVTISFGIIALFVITRSQGIYLFLVLSIIYFIFNRKAKRELLKYFLLLGIFLLILVPVVLLRQESLGYDILLQSTSSTITTLVSDDVNNIQTKQGIVDGGFKVLLNQIGKSLIPYSILFVPFGCLLLVKHFDKKNLTVILVLVSILLTALYILSFNQDMRHIFLVFPIYSVLSLFTINYFVSKNQFKNLFLSLVVLGILVLSVYFLINEDNREIQREAFIVSNYVIEHTSIINGQSLVAHFISPHYFFDKNFPVLSTTLEKHPMTVNLYANSVEDYIIQAKDNDLSHLVIDSQNNRIKPLDEVFYNPQNFPYLHEIYDSAENGFRNYHVKVFEIDYELFLQNSKN